MDAVRLMKRNVLTSPSGSSNDTDLRTDEGKQLRNACLRGKLVTIYGWLIDCKMDDDGYEIDVD